MHTMNYLTSKYIEALNRESLRMKVSLKMSVYEVLFIYCI